MSFAFLCLCFPRALTQAPSERVFAQASPAVVTITCPNPIGNGSVVGSGFIIWSDSGSLDIVTAYHVIKGCFVIHVKFGDGVTVDAHLTQVSVTNDIALISTNSNPRPEIRPLKFIRSISDIPAIGDPIYVIGSPQGLELTLSEGIISSKRHSKVTDLVPAWHIADELQISAAVSPGSSGGPVLTSDGTVIGIVDNQIVSGQNLNFAIESTAINEILPKGIRAEDFDKHLKTFLDQNYKNSESASGTNNQFTKAAQDELTRMLWTSKKPSQDPFADVLDPSDAAIHKATRRKWTASFVTRRAGEKWQVVCIRDCKVTSKPNGTSKGLVWIKKGEHENVYLSSSEWVKVRIGENKFAFAPKSAFDYTPACPARDPTWDRAK